MNKEKYYEISRNLSKNNLTIISGLAKGVDKMSHLGSLNANGNTIAVIGSGLDVVYPKENYEVYQKKEERMASLDPSEYFQKQ